MLVCIPGVSTESFRAHPLHSIDRCWPETNCSLDLWIELLYALGLAPEPALGIAARQDFEGDQFGFTKIPLEDIEYLYGLRVLELASYETLEVHVARQMRRGRLCIISADAYYLPDTAQVGYRKRHTATMIGINRLDCAAGVAEYFHNGGYFRLAEDDYRGLLKPDSENGTGQLPYVEFTTLEVASVEPAELKRRCAALLSKHWADRPTTNPIREFQKVFPEQARALVDRDPEALHDYAFHTARLLGSNFELLGSCLDWVTGATHPLTKHCNLIAEVAKILPFRLAKAVAHGRFERLDTALNPAADAWDSIFDAAHARAVA
jgi:hypothetical protein